MLALLLGTVLSSPASAEEGALAVVPLGVCHFVWGQPGRGIAYAGTQALGGSAMVLGTVSANAALEADDDESVEMWQIVAGGGVALWAGSYMVQVIDGSRLAQIRAVARGEQAMLRRFDLGLHPLVVRHPRFGQASDAAVGALPAPAP